MPRVLEKPRTKPQVLQHLLGAFKIIQLMDQKGAGAVLL